MIIFWNPSNSPTHAMHMSPHFSVSFKFSGQKFIAYTKLIAWLSVYIKPEVRNLPSSGLHILHLFKASFQVISWPASEQYEWVLSDFEHLARRSHAMTHLLYPLGVCCVLYAVHVYKSAIKFGIFTFNCAKHTYACQSALQPWVSLGLLYNQSPPGVRFLNKITFYRMGLLAPCPTPILEDESIHITNSLMHVHNLCSSFDDF
jgi:hypothetical protein